MWGVFSPVLMWTHCYQTVGKPRVACWRLHTKSVAENETELWLKKIPGWFSNNCTILSHQDLDSQVCGHSGIKTLARAWVDKKNPRSTRVRKPEGQSKSEVLGWTKSRERRSDREGRAESEKESKAEKVSQRGHQSSLGSGCPGTCSSRLGVYMQEVEGQLTLAAHAPSWGYPLVCPTQSLLPLSHWWLLFEQNDPILHIQPCIYLAVLSFRQYVPY